MPQLTTLIALIVSLAVLFLSGSLFARQSNRADTFRALDLAVVSWISFFIISRVLGLILNASQLSEVGWSVFPLTQPVDQILVFNSWPWLFFKITDGLFLFLEAGGGILAALLILQIFHRNTKLHNQQVLTTAVKIYFASLIPLAIAAIVNSYLAGNFSIPAGIFLLTTLGISFALSLTTRINIIRLHLIVLAGQFAALIFLSVAASSDSNLQIEVVRVVYVLIMLITVGSWFNQARILSAPKSTPVSSRMDYRYTRTL